MKSSKSISTIAFKASLRYIETLKGRAGAEEEGYTENWEGYGGRDIGRLGNFKVNKASHSVSHSDATGSLYEMVPHQSGVGYIQPWHCSCQSSLGWEREPL